jgi:hypothetical protein
MNLRETSTIASPCCASLHTSLPEQIDEIIENRRWGRFGPIIIVDEIRVCCAVLRVYMSKCWANSTNFPNEDIRERHRVVFDLMDSAQARTQIRGTRGPRYHGESQRRILRAMPTTKVDVTACGNEFVHHSPMVFGLERIETCAPLRSPSETELPHLSLQD